MWKTYETPLYQIWENIWQQHKTLVFTSVQARLSIREKFVWWFDRRKCQSWGWLNCADPDNNTLNTFDRFLITLNLHPAYTNSFYSNPTIACCQIEDQKFLTKTKLFKTSWLMPETNIQWHSNHFSCRVFLHVCLGQGAHSTPVRTRLSKGF